jgi:hypothetical protein
LFRKGKASPFSPHYSDLKRMLDQARRAMRSPELRRVQRVQRDLKVGDIVCMTWGGQTLISNATKGPFVHTAIVVGAGPPPPDPRPGAVHRRRVRLDHLRPRIGRRVGQPRGTRKGRADGAGAEGCQCPLP